MSNRNGDGGDRLELHRRLRAIVAGGYVGLLSAPALVVLNHVAVHAGFADCRVGIGAKAVATMTGAHRTTVRRGIDELLEVGILRRRRKATHRRAAIYELVVPRAPAVPWPAVADALADAVVGLLVVARGGTPCAPGGHTLCPLGTHPVPPGGTPGAPIHVLPVPRVLHEEQTEPSGSRRGRGPRPASGGNARRLQAARITPRRGAGGRDGDSKREA
jgi:hypothetical protein